MPNLPPKSFLLVALILVCFLLGIGGGWLGANIYNHSSHPPTSTTARQQYVSSESQLISQIAKNVGASVVSIDVKSQVNTVDIFGFGQPTTQESAGTGFIIDSGGTILTNRHVVPAEATTVRVTLADGTRYNNVKVIGRTSDSSSLDVAFLKIDDLKGKKLTPVNIGDSSKMQVGDKVVAIGNALGQFQNTVTEGIISGYGRSVTAGDSSGQTAETLIDLFQTDAAINPGNSGGPLVNISSEVIGVNTATASSAQNISFAIPINDIKGLIKSVLQKGQLQQSFLGVRFIPLTDDLAFQLNVNVKRGAYILPASDGQPSIIAGSPAEKAGLKEKDIITKVNSIAIDEKTSLTGALSQFQPGDDVTLTIVRDGKTIKLRATLGSTPSS
jgi:serine protease Do